MLSSLYRFLSLVILVIPKLLKLDVFIVTSSKFVFAELQETRVLILRKNSLYVKREGFIYIEPSVTVMDWLRVFFFAYRESCSFGEKRE